MSYKRNTPDSDNKTPEPFKRSKVVPRSPTEKTEDREAGPEMEEVRKLIEGLGKQLKKDMEEVKTAVRREVKELTEEMRNMRIELSENQEKTENMVREVDQIKQKLERNEEEWREKFERVEWRTEKIEKDRIRNNVVITGRELKEQSEETAKEEVERWIEREMKIKVMVKSVYKIGKEKYIVELREWKDKREIMKRKGALKGKEIFIDADLTRREREIQYRIRTQAKEERSKGAKVKIGHQRLEIDGNTWKWSNREGQLREKKEGTEKTKN